MSENKKLAVVLSGGGVAGIAWETGVLKGLKDNGVDLTQADLFVGTSAGSIVSAQITNGCDIDSLYARQSRPLDSSDTPAQSLFPMMFTMLKCYRPFSTTQLRLARIGAYAINADVAQTNDERMAIIRQRLPVHEWPQNRRLLVTAVDCQDGSLVAWSREHASGVSLVHAVASSCAIPMLVRPQTIGDRIYMDGGIASPTNAQLAKGYERVIIVAIGAAFMEHMAPLSTEIAELRDSGSQVTVIVPDRASQSAVFPNVTDPVRRQPSARAGLAQGT